MIFADAVRLGDLAQGVNLRGDIFADAHIARVFGALLFQPLCDA